MHAFLAYLLGKTVSSNWWCSLFSSPVCLKMYWYCMEKLNLGHSCELQGMKHNHNCKYTIYSSNVCNLCLYYYSEDTQTITLDAFSFHLWFIQCGHSYKQRENAFLKWQSFCSFEKPSLDNHKKMLKAMLSVHGLSVFIVKRTLHVF